ncbi:class I SAM-dependent methyltransferase [Pseudofrankia sp. BMG5.37]|uniref:class I SAM-dependent methyltransferase n=1 Tax=Pseudofrankia sp. BMG5.37 TaxID=3050035 RepID=UPI0028951D9F|nr:class I SAM-dependent methyltransferase [Pseudofrankia sp. BMG5.37]MDT3442622.1 class I SAM-dependent methyltransferase [Pseudofrankia sp. BMG5.37]
MTQRAHWDDVYGRMVVTEVSWFQQEPASSLALVEAAGTGPRDAIVDVGAGASVLVDRLLDAGHTDVTVLDVAADALAETRSRFGPRAADVHWLTVDLLAWQPRRRYRLWHDRAVFHFLTDPADRDRYRAVLRQALAPGGHAVIGTFAADGPTACSGLPTARYSTDELAAQFPDLHVVHTSREEHRTPNGRVQPFTWLLLSDRTDSAGTTDHAVAMTKT